MFMFVVVATLLHVKDIAQFYGQSWQLQKLHADMKINSYIQVILIHTHTYNYNLNLWELYH